MTDVLLAPSVTIWGDFSCPWCALLNVRVEGLAADGRLTVDWRAVQHDPGRPGSGVPPDGPALADFDQVVKVATPAERLWLRLPSRLPNTATPNQRLAAASHWVRPPARGRLFEALWRDDLDIGSAAVLELIQLPGESPDDRRGHDLARSWQAEWEALGAVPAMRDGVGQLHIGGPDCLDLLETLR